MHTSATLFAAGAMVASVAAHGHVSAIVVNGKSFQGYDPSFSYQNPAPKVAGWTAQNLDNGFVEPNSFSSGDIICHKEAKPGQAYVEAAAGDELQIQWSTWPDSHKGPVIDYLASCGGDCTTADKTSLSFVKFQAKGLVSGSAPGTWATDDLISNNFTHTTTLPASLAPGNYVLRHEIIALHSAGQENGAQAYPQCINVKVTGSGSTEISGGKKATAFYTPTDPGIKFNLYTTFSEYPMPGPALWSAAAAKVRRHMRDFRLF
ncbi:Glycoside hydrolase family 61 [Macrophomina phaseolina MS6]|uniref:Glycoside hydrolase family 61 n=2 Tax=Macrophomina phaseolina TaxID=35725 RepID=K2S2D8_MACPH|nr:Glycoside hydrolase family 61 [Macrophomina phaseolina MS6]KAH7058865.1 glycoside hydrolase [Macrophomina phaseolina]